MAVSEARKCTARTNGFLSDRLLCGHSFMDSDMKHNWGSIKINKKIANYFLMFPLKQDNFTSRNRVLFLLE